MKATTAVLFATGLAAVAASASFVKIEGSKGSWRMTRNGEEYFIRGAGGVRDLEKFAAAGGNSVRTWSADDGWKLKEESVVYSIYKGGLMVVIR